MGLDVGNGMSCALDSKIGIEKSEPPSGQLRSGPGTGISLVRTWYTSSSAFCLLRVAASTSESQVKSGRYIPNFIEQTAQCDHTPHHFGAPDWAWACDPAHFVNSLRGARDMGMHGTCPAHRRRWRL